MRKPPAYSLAQGNLHHNQDIELVQHPQEAPSRVPQSISFYPTRTTISDCLPHEWVLPVFALPVNKISSWTSNTQAQLALVIHKFVKFIMFVYQWLVLFYYHVVFNYTYTPQFIYPFSGWQTPGLLLVGQLGIKLPWTFLYMSSGLEKHMFLLGIEHPGVEMLGRSVNLS